MYGPNNENLPNTMLPPPNFHLLNENNVENFMGHIYQPPPSTMIEQYQQFLQNTSNTYYLQSVQHPAQFIYPQHSFDYQKTQKTSPDIKKLLNDHKLSTRKLDKLPFNDLNVTSIKKDLIKYSNMLKEYERLSNILQVFKKTLTNEDWNSKYNELKSKEDVILDILKKYENQEYFLAVQRVVKKNVKKRHYRKTKKKEWQELKKIRNIFREREHRRLDLWLEKMKDEADMMRRQEEIKREADLILSDVTTKKIEAKRYLNLFNTLTKLRNARVQQMKNSGEFISEIEHKSFTQILEKLKKLWTEQLKDYNLEEKGLRVMLSDAEVERVNVEVKITRQVQKKWHEVLFGKRNNKEQIGLANNLEEFIANRFEWDRFVNTDNACVSSKIPIGWVIPCKPSDQEWSKFLVN